MAAQGGFGHTSSTSSSSPKMSSHHNVMEADHPHNPISDRLSNSSTVSNTNYDLVAQTLFLNAWRRAQATSPNSIASSSSSSSSSSSWSPLSLFSFSPAASRSTEFRSLIKSLLTKKPNLYTEEQIQNLIQQTWKTSTSSDLSVNLENQKKAEIFQSEQHSDTKLIDDRSKREATSLTNSAKLKSSVVSSAWVSPPPPPPHNPTDHPTHPTHPSNPVKYTTADKKDQVFSGGSESREEMGGLGHVDSDEAIMNIGSRIRLHTPQTTHL